MHPLLRTPLKETPTLRPLHYREPILAIGSCFTEHISTRLRNARMRVTDSPFGTVYNPASINDQCQRLVGGHAFAEGDLVKTGELWHTWLHHGSYSGTEKQLTLDRLNADFILAHEQALTVQTVLLTVGSAHVYSLKETNRYVANCHKAPAGMFEKHRLTVTECVQALTNAITVLRRRNPALQVLLTVSPVKHLRDGMVENLRSKSTLLLACDAVAQTMADVCYLPVYELVTEELRDYRFYASDMCHPNEMAIDFIWKWFCANALDAETQTFVAEAERMFHLHQHRPLHQDTQAWRAFEAQREAEELRFRERWKL
jgi:hypothetical protein